MRKNNKINQVIDPEQDWLDLVNSILDMKDADGIERDSEDDDEYEVDDDRDTLRAYGYEGYNNYDGYEIDDEEGLSEYDEDEYALWEKSEGLSYTDDEDDNDDEAMVDEDEEGYEN